MPPTEEVDLPGSIRINPRNDPPGMLFPLSHYERDVTRIKMTDKSPQRER
jgi:hypothetical protein